MKKHTIRSETFVITIKAKKYKKRLLEKFKGQNHTLYDNHCSSKQMEGKLVSQVHVALQQQDHWRQKHQYHALESIRIQIPLESKIGQQGRFQYKMSFFYLDLTISSIVLIFKNVKSNANSDYSRHTSNKSIFSTIPRKTSPWEQENAFLKIDSWTDRHDNCKISTHFCWTWRQCMLKIC